VTPSAISQRIRQLEERVGCALVIRAQPCTATATGRHLCHHVDRVRLLEHELNKALPELDTGAGGPVPLPIAVNADSLETWIAPAIAAYAAANPVLMEVVVDDQDHTTEWLRNGAVLAAVTASARPAPGCNSRPLGAMRFVAAASPAFVKHYFADGVRAATLAAAPSLVFNQKDELQARWVRRQCHRDVELPRHMLPSSHAFVTAALAGMGWGMHAHALVADHLKKGRLVELVPDTAFDVPLHWQYARVASGLLDGLGREIEAAARVALLPT
ncbi:MAG TPA: LysR family transcriptional regulator ArgP, partial [Telluria sp.]|nr:LysR family transcriptional regulator ArgP [Telluria sp.]